MGFRPQLVTPAAVSEMQTLYNQTSKQLYCVCGVVKTANTRSQPSHFGVSFMAIILISCVFYRNGNLIDTIMAYMSQMKRLNLFWI